MKHLFQTLVLTVAAVPLCVDAFVSLNVFDRGDGQRFELLFRHPTKRLSTTLVSPCKLSPDDLLADLLNHVPKSGADSSPAGINAELARLYRKGDLDAALKMITSSNNKHELDEISYASIIQELTNSRWPDATEIAEDLLYSMKKICSEYPASTPKRYAYNAVIFAWSKTTLKRAGPRCNELLNELWAIYNKTEDASYLPMKSSYISTLSAWSRSGRKLEAATRGEELLEEMERYRNKHPHLAPTSLCVDAVLTAWSRSGIRGAPDRCEIILNRMQKLALGGRNELKPQTTSFNIVIRTLAQCGGRGSERRAEALLERMDALSNAEGPGWPCKPNQISFNVVLNCWARSRGPGGAGRADAILRHMERRYSSNTTDVYPDVATYTTVMNAWARSRDRDAAERAEQVLRRMETAYHQGNLNARPNAMSYNTIINVWAKSKSSVGANKALETLELMKELSKLEGRDDCSPDVFTYTSVIDCLAKSGTAEASQQAESLLVELEAMFVDSGDSRLRPTIHTYTSVVNVIARSRQSPERAQAIVDRLSAQSKCGKSSLKPDVVLYNALLNAYGWSSMKGKAEKCLHIYEEMMAWYESGQNRDVKPDIITCNSVLNACAFEICDTAEERVAAMDIVARMFAAFHRSAPSFGIPNHITFGYVLLAIGKHMPLNKKRFEAAEATFWQACRSGYLGSLVVTSLQPALAHSWDDFARLMGPALLSKEGEKLRFDLSRLPREWSQNVSPNRRDSQPSSKRVDASVTKLYVKL